MLIISYWKVHQNIEKNSYSVGKEFDNEPVNGDNDKYIGTKIKV